MKNLSIKFKIIFIIAISMLVMLFFIYRFINDSYKKSIDKIATESINNAKESFENLKQNDERTLLSTLQVILQDEKIKDAYLSSNRDNLKKFVIPLFTSLNKDYGLAQFNFYTPNLPILWYFRGQKPSMFGDTVKRKMILDCIKGEKITRGFDLGRTGFSLRVCAPYYDGKKIIGCIELGERTVHFFKMMKQQSGNDYALLLGKKYLNRDDWNTTIKTLKLRDNWDDLKDVVIVDKTSDNSDITKFDGTVESIADKGTVLEQVEKNDSFYVRGVFPIYDAGQRKIGCVFVVHDITNIYNSMKSAQNKVVFIIAILILIISIIIVVFINIIVVKRLNAMIAVAQRVVGGDFYSEIKIKSNDEIGKFEALFEQFRKVFVNILKDMESK